MSVCDARMCVTPFTKFMLCAQACSGNGGLAGGTNLAVVLTPTQATAPSHSGVLASCQRACTSGCAVVTASRSDTAHTWLCQVALLLAELPVVTDVRQAAGERLGPQAHFQHGEEAQPLHKYLPISQNGHLQVSAGNSQFWHRHYVRRLRQTSQGICSLPRNRSLRTSRPAAGSRAGHRRDVSQLLACVQLSGPRQRRVSVLARSTNSN